MPGLDIVSDSIVEFSRTQNWMLSAKKNGDEETYSMMSDRYIELKAILSTACADLTELDIINN